MTNEKAKEILEKMGVDKRENWEAVKVAIRVLNEAEKAEPKPPTFREDEIVSNDAMHTVNRNERKSYIRFGDTSLTSDNYKKLSPAEVAAIVNGTYGPYNFYVVTESGFTLSKDKPYDVGAGNWGYGMVWNSLPKCPEWKPQEGAI